MNSLAHEISQRTGGRPAAVLGIGNRSRQDDGVGSWVAEQLAAVPGVVAFDAETVPENYLGAVLASRARLVWFVDAADHGGAPGACCVAPADERETRRASTHTPSLNLLAGILRSHGIECWLLGIQPASTAPGHELSAAVARTVHHVVDALSAALAPSYAGEVSR